jgi:hypothetical protein
MTDLVNPGAAPGFIDGRLAEQLARPNSVVVATRGARLEPHATRACGLHVVGRDRLCVLLPRATSAQVLDDLRDNGDIAVCASSPVDYTTVQLKGRSVAIADASAEDLLRSERQMRDLAAAAAHFGLTLHQVRNLWLFECWRVEVQVTSVYTQTPGPGAGEPLKEPARG